MSPIDIINAPRVTKRKVSIHIAYTAPEERENYNTELCWYCGKKRAAPPIGCTLTHKDDPLEDAKYPKQDPYKSMRDKNNKINRPSTHYKG